MKIDIGSEGKILGTKRVSPNGQVSGLSEFAGEEVLIIYPGPREPRVRMEPKDLLKEVERAVHHQMRATFVQYKGLKQRYRDEAEATRAFLRTKSPKGFHGLMDAVDEWARAQIEKAERRVAATLSEDGAPGAGSGDGGEPGAEGTHGDEAGDETPHGDDADDEAR